MVNVSVPVVPTSNWFEAGQLEWLPNVNVGIFGNPLAPKDFEPIKNMLSLDYLEPLSKLV